MSDRFALDDAAAAALFGIRNAPIENMGALYGDQLKRSNVVSNGTEDHVKARLQIPGGAAALRALFHNHPPTRFNIERERFSPDDKTTANRLRVPSYISVGDAVMRYDPATKQTEEVLAQFPIDEWRAQIMRTILNRAPDDPRGALR